MDIKNSFATQFAQIGQANNKAEFEIRFNQVQRGLVNQLNAEIEKVQNDDAERRISRLQSQRDDLFEKADTLRTVRDDLQTNALRFLEISSAASSATAATDEDENASLSGDELTALNTAIAQIKEEVFKIKSTLSYEGITDGNLSNSIRADIEALEALTAVEGTIDAEGTTPATNDNRAILDALTSLSNKALTYSESTRVLVESANQLVSDTTARAFSVETDLADLTFVEIEKKEQEIGDLQTRYSNLIRAISLAFEVQSGLGDALAAGTKFEPEPGSILNIFS